MPLFARADPISLDDGIALVGLECLAYLAGCGADEIRAQAARTASLTDGQLQSLNAGLLLLGSPVVQSPREGEMKTAAAVSVLTAFDEESGTTIANRLRLQAGGTLPEITTTDAVEAALAHLASDSYVALLVPPDTRFGFSVMSNASLFRNAWDGRFKAAVLADAELGQHFVGPPEGTASSFSYMSTTGHGEGGVQLFGLAQRLLSTPAAICRARGCSPSSFVAAAVEAVEHLRRLVGMGRTVRARTLLGLDGLVLPPGSRVESEWGTLRVITNGERELLSGYAGTGNAVIEAEYPVKLHKNEDPELPVFERPSFREMRQARLDLDQRVRMVALAVILVGDVQLPAAIGYRFTLIEDPFGHMPSISGRIDTAPRAPVELTTEQIDELGRWLGHLAEHHCDAMNVAVRRVLSAHDRLDPTDAFIDALIAWDALFGAQSGDAVTFRVTTGMALLLGKTEQERRDIKSIAAGLYTLRSNLVHGSVPELPWEEAEQYRVNAAELLVRALRELYRNRPALLASQDRTSGLIMQIANEAVPGEG